MDRSSSCGSNSSALGKNLGKPPLFKLCFPKDRLAGKSNIRASKINGETITPKFYSKRYEFAEEKHEAANPPREESAEERESDCNLSGRRAWLSSHAYGWWHERGIQPAVESRFEFRKRASDLVNFGTNVAAAAAAADERNFRSSKQ